MGIKEGNKEEWGETCIISVLQAFSRYRCTGEFKNSLALFCFSVFYAELLASPSSYFVFADYCTCLRRTLGKLRLGLLAVPCPLLGTCHSAA